MRNASRIVCIDDRNNRGINLRKANNREIYKNVRFSSRSNWRGCGIVNCWYDSSGCTVHTCIRIYHIMLICWSRHFCWSIRNNKQNKNNNKLQRPYSSNMNEPRKKKSCRRRHWRNIYEKKKNCNMNKKIFHTKHAVSAATTTSSVARWIIAWSANIQRIVQAFCVVSRTLQTDSYYTYYFMFNQFGCLWWSVHTSLIHLTRALQHYIANLQLIIKRVVWIFFFACYFSLLEKIVFYERNRKKK